MKVDKLFFVGGEGGSLIKDYSLFFISSYSLTVMLGLGEEGFQDLGGGFGLGVRRYLPLLYRR